MSGCVWGGNLAMMVVAAIRATVANFFRMLLSTSHTWEMRAFALFAFKDERCAYARPFRPMTAKLSRLFDPRICA